VTEESTTPAPLGSPDLVIALDADERTPDAACFCVGTIARPAPAARERAQLLTGALLARAAHADAASAGRPVELRVWSRSGPARIELSGPAELLDGGVDEDGSTARLLEQHADRWGIHFEGARTRVWFEIAVPVARRPGGDRGAVLAAQPV
jgi:hypothetical protein